MDGIQPTSANAIAFEHEQSKTAPATNLETDSQHCLWTGGTHCGTWPMSTAGLRECPASIMTSPRRTRTSPVRTSTCVVAYTF